MDTLRWILLIAGILLLAGIYWYGRRRETRDSAAMNFSTTVRDPLFESHTDETLSETVPPDSTEPVELQEFSQDLQALNQLLTESAPKSKTATDVTRRANKPEKISALVKIPEKIIAVHLLAAAGEYLSGHELENVFKERGYVFGEMAIYHALHADEILFSIANLVKPGYFEPEKFDQFTTPGLSLFLRLPGPMAPNSALEALLSEAQILAERLNANLQDETHSTLTAQTMQHLRDQVRDYGLKYFPRA